MKIFFLIESFDRSPLSKFVSDYGQDSYKDSELCGATEEFQDMQQTGQTSDFYDYTQQSSNDAEFQVLAQQTLNVPELMNFLALSFQFAINQWNLIKYSLNFGNYIFSLVQTFQSQDFGSFGDFGGQQSAQTPQRLVEELATDAELARASYGAPDATEPILDYYIPYLRREKGWRKLIV